MRTRLAAISLVLVVSCLLWAPSAIALSGTASSGSAASAEYPDPDNKETLNATASGGDSGGGGSLPFTGLAVLSVAGLGALILSGGLVLRHRTRET